MYVVDPVPRHALPIALAKFVLLGSILLGSLFFGGALLLSALGGYVGVEAPTSDEIRTGINQRTTERMTDAEARFEELNQ